MTDSEQRNKRHEVPIDGPYPLLATEVRRLMGYSQDGEDPERSQMSTRQAARISGVNHATIATMFRGDRASEGTLFKFAKGLGGDPMLLLEYAGYDAAAYLSNEKAAEFSGWLNNAMDDANVTIKVLAASTGLGMSTISQLKSDYRNPSRETVQKIAPALFTGDPEDTDAFRRFLNAGLLAAGLAPEDEAVDPDFQMIAEAYEGFPPAARHMLKEQVESLKRLLQEGNANDSTIGKKAE